MAVPEGSEREHDEDGIKGKEDCARNKKHGQVVQVRYDQEKNRKHTQKENNDRGKSAGQQALVRLQPSAAADAAGTAQTNNRSAHG